MEEEKDESSYASIKSDRRDLMFNAQKNVEKYCILEHLQARRALISMRSGSKEYRMA